MTSERWQRLKEILTAVLAEPAGRHANVLDALCGADAELRLEVEALLASQPALGDFLEPPAVEPPETPRADMPDDLRRWTRYEILDVVGRGGMAAVYKARDPELQRLVAVKVISGGDPITIRRFLREAEAQARVEHDNVLKVYETGTFAGHQYIAMQYIAGPTLMGVRDETSLDHKVRLMRQIAEGLHAAHRQGLIHRDIKPGNILVERGEDGLKPYLLDFGLAVELGAPGLTQDGVVIGTPRYMAPERVAHGAPAIDRRSDIYSLGATFYEFLSGVPPFGDSSGLQVLVDVMRQELEPIAALMPSLPRELDAVLSKCLEPDPQRRYASARLLAEDLGRYLDGEPVLARPSGLISRAARKARRYPRAAAAFASLALVAIAAGGWSGYSYWRASRQTSLSRMLGQQMQDLEWMLRAAQMSPLHSILPAREEVRGRLDWIGRLVESEGSWARAPGNYALGRGYLTIGEPARALEHLQRAWDAGYRTPDAALALGLAHTEIFRIESARAQRISSDDERRARLKALEPAHRDPALRFLEAGRSGGIVTPRYVEALISAHRNDFEAAAASAGQAVQQMPWLFEARLLTGHIAFDAANRLYSLDRTSDAHAQTLAADRQYAEAQRIAPSSVDAYLGRCAVSGLLLHMTVHGYIEDGRGIDEAVAPCANALTVDSTSADAHRLASEAYRFWGNTRVLKNADPGDAYVRAEAFARRAVERSAGEPDAIATLAGAYMDRAWWESRTGRDPRPSVDLAVATFEKAIAIKPYEDDPFNEMGQSLLLRARYEAAKGLDPLPSFDRAIASFERGALLNPSTMFHYNTLAKAAGERAAFQSRSGIDPLPGLRAMLQFIDRLGGDPNLPARIRARKAVNDRIAELAAAQPAAIAARR